MSKNFIIYATAICETPNGKKVRHSETFETWQVPDKEIDDIINSDNQFKKYAEFCRSVCPEYAEIVPASYEDYIGMKENGKTLEEIQTVTQIIDEAEEHIEELKKFIEYYEDIGFSVKFDIFL